MRLAALPGPLPRPLLFLDVSFQDSGRARRGPFFFAERSLAAHDAARFFSQSDPWPRTTRPVFGFSGGARRGAAQAGGSEVSASPSGRCMITESVQRPSLNPADVRTPTGRNPNLRCKFMDAVFAESPITATICR